MFLSRVGDAEMMERWERIGMFYEEILCGRYYLSPLLQMSEICVKA